MESINTAITRPLFERAENHKTSKYTNLHHKGLNLERLICGPDTAVIPNCCALKVLNISTVKSDIN